VHRLVVGLVAEADAGGQHGLQPVERHRRGADRGGKVQLGLGEALARRRGGGLWVLLGLGQGYLWG
jgi:hypothetical protein